jgi:hypothetical protein
MVLSTVAVTLPASVICLQRITSVANGSAYVDVWADTITWSGWLEMKGPDGLVSNYPSNGVKT